MGAERPAASTALGARACRGAVVLAAPAFRRDTGGHHELLALPEPGSRQTNGAAASWRALRLGFDPFGTRA